MDRSEFGELVFKVVCELPFGIEKNEIYFWEEFNQEEFALSHKKIKIGKNSLTVTYEPIKCGLKDYFCLETSPLNKKMALSCLKYFLQSNLRLTMKDLDFLFLTVKNQIKYFNPKFFQKYKCSFWLDNTLFESNSSKIEVYSLKTALNYLLNIQPPKAKELNAKKSLAKASKSSRIRNKHEDFMLKHFEVSDCDYKKSNMIEKVPNRVKLEYKHSFTKVWSEEAAKKLSDIILSSLLLKVNFKFEGNPWNEDDILKILYTKNFNETKTLVALEKAYIQSFSN